MFLFGVTGGIGCGKTAVCNFLKQKGIPILEADPVAKELTNTLPEIREALTREFGEEVYSEAGLNREKLSKLVFTDPGSRKRINRIIHPHVLHWIQNEARRLKKEEHQELVGVEAALIYESGMDKMLDAVVVVTAPLENRIRWIQQRNNLPTDEIIKRIDSQMLLAEKVKRAEYVIENNASLDELEAKVDDLVRWVKQRSRG
ncbi:dephospho-CoA kinase [candidate division KSB1 bacterium]|nr:dephospho-CoA kinase [candidate division KSB1 bacterium]NIR68730.1 dephospho-CoA kinase [candidate division KSB1 bacterium]NIS25547.1 dephospho-CoA kinase [candidate division KSB1 bacterium]NIT72440.1 dephospho-CoA kinase [candidate division KSB1 bacterium]NIU26224.1 dephospho-CoA kinase [candidate division KSB1 bacterium]